MHNNRLPSPQVPAMVVGNVGQKAISQCSICTFLWRSNGRYRGRSGKGFATANRWLVTHHDNPAGSFDVVRNTVVVGYECAGASIKRIFRGPLISPGLSKEKAARQERPQPNFSRQEDFSRHRRRAFAHLPQLQLWASLEPEVPLLPGRRKASSVGRCDRPEIQVHHGASAAVPC